MTLEEIEKEIEYLENVLHLLDAGFDKGEINSFDKEEIKEVFRLLDAGYDKDEILSMDWELQSNEARMRAKIELENILNYEENKRKDKAIADLEAEKIVVYACCSTIKDQTSFEKRMQKDGFETVCDDEGTHLSERNIFGLLREIGRYKGGLVFIVTSKEFFRETI